MLPNIQNKDYIIYKINIKNKKLKQNISLEIFIRLKVQIELKIKIKKLILAI